MQIGRRFSSADKKQNANQEALPGPKCSQMTLRLLASPEQPYVLHPVTNQDSQWVWELE